ncbi:hypothetical protein ACMAUO_11740 [Gluconacetobacter sp. Hr-1-5]|uniref:hypothetical protein n=1 Tax=Gluconacetobacter sp. Hr-1-5 TaxID=3395370 RepID=UPI003B52A9BD
MLTAAEMAAIDARHTDTPPTFLWSDQAPDGTGPNLLARFMNLCRACNTYLHDAPWQPDLGTILRQHGGNDFHPAPSQGAVIGIMTAWPELNILLRAEESFSDLTSDEPPELADRLFLPMRFGLIWFRLSLRRNRRTAEFWRWADTIGWDSLIDLAATRDRAVDELIAGRAFVTAEANIAAVPGIRLVHASG